MYNLMLVDDEPEIREGLQEIIDFEALGFTMVGEAENGIEALQICETLRPDVVITDIRMPLMDGITMVREMKKILPAVQFIILSGYDDFSYAQQAIELKSLRYLLKPITSAEFIKILQSVRKTLDEDFDRRRNVTMLREHFQSSLPLLRENLLRSLAQGAISMEAAIKMAAQCDIALQANRYMFALFRVNDDTFAQRNAITDPWLQWVAIEKIAKEIILQEHHAYFFHFTNHELAVLFLLYGESEQAFSDVLQVLEETQKYIEHYLSLKISIGVSADCQQINQLHQCAKQAMSALDQSCIIAKGQIICVTDLESRKRQLVTPDRYTLSELITGLKTNDYKACETAVRALIDALVKAEPTPKLYRVYMMDICISVMRDIQDLLDQPVDFEKAMNALLQCPPMEAAQTMLLEYCRILIRKIDEQCISSSQLLVHKATEILKQEFGNEDMNIDSICKRLHISTSYFGALFKRETGKPFHQYLIQMRMDKAMNMLVTSAAKTAEVALAVGIPDPSYFSYAFKKHFGTSPSQAGKRRRQ